MDDNPMVSAVIGGLIVIGVIVVVASILHSVFG